MKKIFFLFIIVLLTGCKNNISASSVVTNYLNSYKALDKTIDKEIDAALDNIDEYNIKQKNTYKSILKRQYKSLEYDILKEEYDENKVLITVNINVYDLNKAEEEAIDYLSENLNLFYDSNNNFDNEKYLSYKLDLMKKTNNRIDYEIIFYLEKIKGKWVLEQPTESDLEKISGTYINE